ncbi:acetoacetate decarboxylase family protein [Aquihabitans daechungensis]|uniref:acetoacetate decarboxylase family protein n=1 Tax=Aquihabitans daechungensis TaxID=1052257 RepID=UPI003BA083DE
MSETTEPQVWGEIDGRTITFPMEVRDFDAATLVFSVPARAAQALLPGTDFSVIEMVDGIAQFVVALCDYHDNPWGDYLEVNLGFLTRPNGAGDEVLGSFVYRMPVDQEFTCKAGNEVMGFPKTVQALSTGRRGDRVYFAMHVDGELELEVSFLEPKQDGPPSRVETGSYSYLHGAPHETPLSMDMGSGLIDVHTVEVGLGHGLVATELRTLGLPKVPDFGTWGTGLTATFQLGHPLEG